VVEVLIYDPLDPVDAILRKYHPFHHYRVRALTEDLVCPKLEILHNNTHPLADRVEGELSNDFETTLLLGRAVVNIDDLVLAGLENYPCILGSVD
jgi:hypothetical protein